MRRETPPSGVPLEPPAPERPKSAPVLLDRVRGAFSRGRFAVAGALGAGLVLLGFYSGLPAAVIGVLGAGLAALILALEGRRAPEKISGVAGVSSDGANALDAESAAEANPAGLPEGAESLVDAFPDAVIIADADGRMIAANRRAQIDLVGQSYLNRQLATVIRRPAILEAVQRVRESGQSEQIAFSDLVPVERHFKAYVSGLPLFEGSAAAVLICVWETTQEMILEQMRADFVANASHELRTPLSSLSGFIETLRGHAKDDPDARERFLVIMQDQAQRMRRLIDDLLSLSRIELNEHVPPQDRVDLKGVVADVAAALQPLAQAMKVAIDVEVAPDLPDVLGTRDELVQVLQNLVDNALKYGGTAGPVKITAARGVPSWVQGVVGETCHVCVSDHGEGIPREHIPRLTERFYRVDVNKSRERGGTGLGLAIVKHIVSRHRGRLHIKSEPGQGSAFTVILPVAEA